MDMLGIIKNNLVEIIGEEKLVEKLNSEKKLSAYWGTAPTGEIHVGYLIPLIKIRDLTRCNISVKILLADLHSTMDANKTPFNKVNSRTQYYEIVITKLLEIMKIDMRLITFIKGSNFQNNLDYMSDIIKLSTVSSLRNCQKAGSDVVKKANDPIVSNILYPMLQALDEHYLDVDIELGGVDQRKIFTFAIDHLPKIGYSNSIYLMNPILGSISSSDVNIKMSSSQPDSKISFTDTEENIRRKINKSPCNINNFESSQLCGVLNMIIFPIVNTLEICREEKYGGHVAYTSVSDISNDLKNENLNIGDLKKAIGDYFVKISDQIKECFDDKKNIFFDAYDHNLC
jgi:tyrosyl-tRNA synthetase